MIEKLFAFTVSIEKLNTQPFELGSAFDPRGSQVSAKRLKVSKSSQALILIVSLLCKKFSFEHIPKRSPGF